MGIPTECIPWTTPTAIIEDAAFYSNPIDRLFRTLDGTLLMPISQITNPGNSSTVLEGYLTLLRSTDNGNTWTVTNYPSITGPSNKFFEPGIYDDIFNGDLHMYFRTLTGFAYESISTDDGLTWSAPTRMKWLAPNAMLSIERLKGSDVYIAATNQVTISGNTIGATNNWTNRRSIVIYTATNQPDGRIGNFESVYKISTNDSGSSNTDYIFTPTIHEHKEQVLISYINSIQIPSTAQNHNGNFHFKVKSYDKHSFPVYTYSLNQARQFDNGILVNSAENEDVEIFNGITDNSLTSGIVSTDLNGTLRNAIIGSGLNYDTGTNTLTSTGGGGSSFFVDETGGDIALGSAYDKLTVTNGSVTSALIYASTSSTTGSSIFQTNTADGGYVRFVRYGGAATGDLFDSDRGGSNFLFSSAGRFAIGTRSADPLELGYNRDVKLEIGSTYSKFRNSKPYIEGSGNGIVLVAPDGGCWELTVSNAGSAVFTSITCP